MSFFFVCVSFSSFSLSLSSHFGFNRIFSLPTARNRVDSVLWTATAVTRALLGCYRVFFLFDSGCLFTECHWLRQLWISTVGYRVVIDFLVLPGYSGFYQVLPGYNQVSPGFTGFYLVLPGFTKFHRVLLGFTGFLSSFTRFYLVLPSLSGFYQVLPSLSGFYQVLLGFTKFYRVLSSFTGFYRVLPSFT